MAKKRLSTTLVGALFFVSGFSGLVYEVLWTRSLTLVFGNTVVAVSTVLAAFMGGLALGAWVVGRKADAVKRPLLLYGLLETLVGISALVFPLYLKAIVPILRSLYQGGHTDGLAVFRFLAAFIFMLIPTAAMGGTLPTLAKLLARVETAGRTLSWLYGVNTLGAAAGTVAAGFWFLPSFGLSGTLTLGVTMNGFVALSAVALAYAVGTRGKKTRERPRGQMERPTLGAREKIVLWGFLVSGAIALAIEVLWTRGLLLVFGSTVYSFSTMLAVFLLGLALGSAVVGLFVERIPYPVAALGIVEAGVAFVTLASVARFNGLPSHFLDGLIAHGLTWDAFITQKVLIAEGILFPVAILFGATFPLVARMEVFRERRIGSQVGLLYAFNTVGAIAGSLLAGFLLLPLLGLEHSLLLVALVALCLGLVLIMAESKAKLLPRLSLTVLLLAAGTVAVITPPRWSEKIFSAGVYFHPRSYMSANLKHNLLNERLGAITVLKYVEGVTETAAVIKTPAGREFIVDGKVEASTLFEDMRLQRLQGILPMLFAPRYGKALNIGLGCGITLGGLKAFPLKSFQCVELEKKILTTAPFFAKQNLNVLEDPRLKVIINDGRNHLLLTDQKYDVITSDPFEPLVGGAANLYTVEHFRNGKKRLKPGGIFAQYLPLYQLSPDGYRMIIRSFCSVFPRVSLWYTGTDSIMLGSRGKQSITLEELKKRMAIPAVKASLAGIGVTNPAQLLQTFVMDPSKIPEIAEKGALNTDRHPYIEFSAPRSHLVNTTPENLAWLLKNYRPQDLPLDLSTEEARAVARKAETIGKLVMEASLARFEGRYEDAFAAARRARKLDPTNRAVLFELATDDNIVAKSLLAENKFDAAKPLLDEAEATGIHELSTLENLATWAFHTNRPDLALSFTRKAISLNPHLPESNLRMALCLLALNRPDEALPWCEKAVKLNPAYTQAVLTRGDIALRLGNIEKAAGWYGKGLNADGAVTSGADWRVYGFILAKLGRFAEARKTLLKAVRMSPSDPGAWMELARVNHALGSNADAQSALRKAKALAGK